MNIEHNRCRNEHYNRCRNITAVETNFVETNIITVVETYFVETNFVETNIITAVETNIITVVET